MGVTGATGHIGNVLTRRLVELGESVRAFTAPGEDLSPLAGIPAEIVEADIRDEAKLTSYFRGLSGVIHLAGRISLMPYAFQKLLGANVEGTKTVIRACRAAQVPRLVTAGSIHAFPDLPSGQIITEATPILVETALGSYGKTKAMAVIEAQKAAAEGMDISVVCPTGVLGPYDFKLSQIGRMMLDFLSGKLNFTMHGEYDYIDVRDAAEAFILALRKGQRGAVYIASGQVADVPEIIGELARVTGMKPPRYHVPDWIARTAAAFTTFGGMIAKKEIPLCLESLDILHSNCRIDSSRTQAELGLSVRNWKESVRDTAEWLIENRYRLLKPHQLEKFQRLQRRIAPIAL